MRSSQENITIVIPAYNEEKRIEGVLEKYNETGDEILVVSNGSTDRTVAIVKRLSMTNERIKVLEYPNKLGKGGAVVEGLKMASGDIVGFVDADESTSAEGLGLLIRTLIEKNVQGAIGSRWVKGSRIITKQPLKRRIAGRVFNILVRIMFGLPYSDTQCGAKVFRKEAIQEILPEIKLTGFEFDVELLWRLRRTGFTVAEVPITWNHEPGSTFSLTNAPRMFLNLCRIRIGLG